MVGKGLRVMLQTGLAVGYAVLIYNVVFFTYGWPVSGTVGSFILLLSVQMVIILLNAPKLFKFWGGRGWFRNGLTISGIYAWITICLALMASYSALFRGSFVDRVLLDLASFGLSMISVYLLALTHDNFGSITETFYAPIKLGWEYVRVSHRGMDRLGERLWTRIAKKEIPEGGLGVTSIHLIRALMVTVPIALLIILLLTLADPVFRKLVYEILLINWPNWVIPKRLIYTLILAILVIPLGFLKIQTVYNSPLNKSQFKNYGFEILVLLMTLTVILGIFLVIQFKYLFAKVPETALIQFGVKTYSEYVRKGFGELILVSMLVYGCVGGALVVFRNQVDGFKLKAVSVVLLGEALVFMTSIWRRVVLYQYYHGLTRIRVYGLMVVVGLMGLTLILMMRFLKKGKTKWFVYEVGLILVMLLTGTLMNTDKLIAKNFKPSVNGEIDYVYISRLSSDAVEGWIDAFNESRTYLNESVVGNQDWGSLDDKRKAYYHLETVNRLLKNWRELEVVYGENQGMSDFMLRKVYGGNEVLGDSLNRVFYTNFADMNAYEQLKRKTREEDLYWLADQLEKVIGDPSEIVPVLDRSSQSPLID